MMPHKTSSKHAYEIGFGFYSFSFERKIKKNYISQKYMVHFHNSSLVFVMGFKQPILLKSFQAKSIDFVKWTIHTI